MTAPARDARFDVPIDVHDTSLHVLTRVAFVSALVLATARALSLLYLRDVAPVLPLSPGEQPAPRYAGPAVGVVLDVLCLVPAWLVLLRRAADPTCRLPPVAGVAFLAALGVWAFWSLLWAGDPWAASVEGSTWVAAAAVLFALAAGVGGWADVRLGAGLLAGVLACNVVSGVWFLVVDHPDLVATFEADLERNLRDRNLDPGSPGAELLLGRLRRGEITGTTASVNSFAATLVALSLISAGLAWSALRSRFPSWSHFGTVAGLLIGGCVLGAAAAVGGGDWAWPLVGVGTASAAAGATVAIRANPAAFATLTCVAVPAATFLLVRTASRTAMLALLLAIVGLCVVWLRRNTISHRLVAYGVVAAILGGSALLLAVGYIRQDVLHVSLLFRSYYWQGAVAAWVTTPVTGVGFANFADAYLLHRVPQAAEEVRDPHNLPLRWLAELGVIGLLLGLGWLVATARDAGGRLGNLAAGGITDARKAAGVAGAAGVVVVASVVDFAADPGFVALEVMRYGVLTLVLALCASVAVARDAEGAVDDTPAPALVGTLLAAVGALLLHAMLDVVVFSTSVLFVTVIVLGLTLGTRRRTLIIKPAVAWAVVAAFGVGVLAHAALFAVPVVLAERTAGRGDGLVRAGTFFDAARAYQRAFDAAPVSNADYLARAGRAYVFAGDDASATRMYGLAAGVEPTRHGHLLAVAAMAERAGDYMQAVAAQRAAVALNPVEVSLHLRLGELLGAAGDAREAAGVLRRALELDDAFAPDEPKRLTPEVVAALRERIARLEAGG